MNASLAVTICVAVVTSCLTTFLGPWVQTYFNDLSRTQAQLVISPGGMQTDVPASTVGLTGDELISLDNMTSEKVPASLEDAIRDYQTTTLSQLSLAQKTQAAGPDSEDTIIDVMKRRTIVQSVLSLHKEHEISTEDIEFAIELVISKPSESYVNAQKASGKIPEEQVLKIREIAMKATSILPAIHEIDLVNHKLGGILLAMDRSSLFSDLSDFTEWMQGPEPYTESGILKGNKDALDKAKRAVQNAHRRQTDERKYDVFLTLSNVSQIPITISRWATLSFGSGNLMDVLEVSHRSDNLVVSDQITLAPNTSLDLTLVSPPYQKTKYTWTRIEEFRGNTDARASVKLLVSTNRGDEVISSKEFFVSLIADRRKSIVVTTNKKEITQVDVLEALAPKKTVLP